MMYYIVNLRAQSICYSTHTCLKILIEHFKIQTEYDVCKILYLYCIT